MKIFFSTKLIYVDHYSLRLKSFKDFIMINLSQVFIDHYVALNDENYSYIKKSLINKRKITKIYNGIDLNLFNSKIKKTLIY